MENTLCRYIFAVSYISNPLVLMRELSRNTRNLFIAVHKYLADEKVFLPLACDNWSYGFCRARTGNGHQDICLITKSSTHQVDVNTETTIHPPLLQDGYSQMGSVVK